MITNKSLTLGLLLALSITATQKVFAPTENTGPAKFQKPVIIFRGTPIGRLANVSILLLDLKTQEQRATLAKDITKFVESAPVSPRALGKQVRDLASLF